MGHPRLARAPLVLTLEEGWVGAGSAEAWSWGKLEGGEGSHEEQQVTWEL